MKLKKAITATIDRELYDFIENELKKTDEIGRKEYRNRSQVVEDIIRLGVYFKKQKESKKK